MKQTIYFTMALAFFGLLFQACKKSPASNQSTDQAFIQSAKAYFEAQLQQISPSPGSNNRIKASKQPYWQAAYTTNSASRQLVVVPVFYQKDLVVSTDFTGSQLLSLNNLTKLVLYKDSSGFSAELVTYFPDSSYGSETNNNYSGLIFAETWDGKPLNKYKFSQGIAMTESSPSQTTGSEISTTTTSQKETTGIISQCTTIYGYNYSADDPDDDYSWSEPGGCTYEYLAPEVVGRGVSPSSLTGLLGRPLPTLAVIITPPKNIIANILDYIKCFSNYGGSDHTYQVTICVDQPDPGTRQAWAFTSTGVAGSSSGVNPVDVGHTYLVLSENFSGYSIVRNVGFYPQTNVAPWTPSAQGQLNDDDGHGYNILLTVTVDNGQFFNILNYISQGNNSGYMYDLNTNNCTSFALHALEAGGVDLPTTVGTWPDGGFGYDPGDLGEDIRNMALTSNMTRSTNYSDHPNQYSCN